MTDIIRLKQQEAVLRLQGCRKAAACTKECGYETRLFND